MDKIVTTPLYYVNDKPHLGSAYTTLATDCLARYYRLEGHNVAFITGVDEHGLKIQKTAELKGYDPQFHCNVVSKEFSNLWNKYHISNDRFIRTTSSNHINNVNKFFELVKKSGDIKLAKQQGWYCIGCEEFKDIDITNKNPVCSIHKCNLEWQDEENLFFCLSKYQDRIEELIDKDNFILPVARKNEIRNFVKNGLRDFSISRINLQWGIPVPGFEGHTFYVWFDALVGYLTAILEHNSLSDISEITKCGWPRATHIIGKDILRFHAVYWPAMLISAGFDPPECVFGHGFLTREGQKMGKSLGNVLDPLNLLNVCGEDRIRWYLLKDISFGQDGDFQQQRLIDIVNNDLANTIGNLLNRTTSMSRKWFDNKTPILSDKTLNNNRLRDNCISTSINVRKHISNLRFSEASKSIMDLAIEANSYINESEPWSKIKTEDQHDAVKFLIYDTLETIRIIGILLKPFVPIYSKNLLSQLGLLESIDTWESQLNWGLLPEGYSLPTPKPLISRLELDKSL